MKKYIKPAIEEVNLGATMPLMTSGGSGEISIDTSGTIIDPTGDDGGSGMWAPSKKGSNDEDFGW